MVFAYITQGPVPGDIFRQSGLESWFFLHLGNTFTLNYRNNHAARTNLIHKTHHQKWLPG